MFKPEYEGSFDDLGSKIGSGVDCDLCKVVSLSSAMANHIRTELKCTKINYFKLNLCKISFIGLKFFKSTVFLLFRHLFVT